MNPALRDPMSTPSVDEARTQAILSSAAGFPFLFAMSFAWLAAGGVSYLLPPSIAGWIYPLAGIPTMFAAIVLERRIGYIPTPKPDPFLGLAMQVLFIQVLAFPAVAIVWDSAPEYLPVAFAAVVGAHFLPFEWIYRTRLYRFLGIVVAIGPYVLAILFRERALHYTGFFVGPVLMVGAFLARSHAAATWRSYTHLPGSGPVADSPGG